MSAALSLRAIAAQLAVELGQRDPAAAWGALGSGEFAVVDRFQHEGRSFILAQRRESFVRTSRRERRALELRAHGLAVKVIAYELGVSQATVSRDIGRAMEKLGLVTQVDLVRLFVRASNDHSKWKK